MAATIPRDARAAIITAFDRLPGESGAVAVLPGGERVTHDADRRLRAASVIKLWIAAAAFEADATGRLSLAERRTIEPPDQAPGTGILNQARYLGRGFSYTELIDIMLMYSDNSAANLIVARIGGVGAVSEYARRHGYHETLMQRTLGVIDRSRDNYTSARDCVRFVEELLQKRVVGEQASESILASLGRRRAGEDRSYDYFGRLLPATLPYRQISGLNPGVRNDVGYYPSANGAVVVAVLLSELPDEAAGEEAIGRAVAAVQRAAP